MPHQVPAFRHHPLRTAAGLLLAGLSPFAAAALLDRAAPGFGVVALVMLAWVPAVWLTDKYVHKYPQRYDTYLMASHLKAAAVMAVR